ncbi:MAG: penicillin-binding protein 2 [Candidatus Neomarinimicrobiota bacterium]
MLKADNIASIRQYYFASCISCCLIALLIIRFFQLQIVDHDQYSKKANTNRIRKVTSSAPRGLILDRNGQILVANLPTYILNAVPGELPDKGATFDFISKIIGVDSILLARNYKKYYRGRFIPTRIAKDLTFSQISRIEENRLNLEGVYFQKFPERYFPSSVRASHILGYVKEVDKDIRSNLNNPLSYELGDIIGWSGLEKSYENDLKGTHGIQFYQVDAFGREAGYVEEFPPRIPEPGKNIITTIDINMQNSLEQHMVGKRGVIIVGIPLTGEILGAVSNPDFRPDLFTGRILEDEWNNVINNQDKPLLNRFNQGLYPPGSIVKMITEAALLDHPDFDPYSSLLCEGSFQFGDRVFGCWNTLGHGNVDLTSAIMQSCDIYFYKTINYYDLDKLAKFFKGFGFGLITGIDIHGEYKGTVPDTDYMNQRYGRFGWSKGALLNFCIGQGEILVTPIQVFNYTNLLATKGRAKRPHFVMSDTLQNITEPSLPLDVWERIIFDMGQVINNINGTGKNANIDLNNINIFGKTGTAENPHGEDHAWFIGWLELHSQVWSVVVLLENAGSGGTVAAPLAKKVFMDILYNYSNINAMVNK